MFFRRWYLYFFQLHVANHEVELVPSILAVSRYADHLSRPITLREVVVNESLLSCAGKRSMTQSFAEWKALTAL